MLGSLDALRRETNHRYLEIKCLLYSKCIKVFLNLLISFEVYYSTLLS